MAQLSVAERHSQSSGDFRLRRALGTAALIVVALAPLPLGSNRPLWWTLLAVLVGVMMVTDACRHGFRRQAPDLSVAPLLSIALPFLAVLVWATLQALPIMPNALWHPLWESAGHVLGSPITGAISLNREESLIGVMRLATYAGIFWLFVQLARERAFAERALRVFAYAGFGYALYGLAMTLLGIERTLWLEKWAYQGAVTSTFVNRNSYATYAALGLLCAGALTFDKLRDILAMPSPLRRKAKLAIAILGSSGMAPALATAVLAMALLQTGSRAGAFSAFVGIVVFVLAAAYAQLLRWRQAMLAIVLLTGAGLALVALSGRDVVERLHLLDADEAARSAIYALVLRAIGDAPLIGTGLGTFPEIFTIYRDETFDTFRRVSEAHSSYLENALELGVPATVLLMASLAAIAEANFVALRRRRRGRMFPALGLAALGTVAVHASVDFSLEVPAVAVTFAALSGVACAQSFRSKRPRRSIAPDEAILAASPQAGPTPPP